MTYQLIDSNTESIIKSYTQANRKQARKRRDNLNNSNNCGSAHYYVKAVA